MSRETSLLSPSLIPRPRWARTPSCSGSDLDFKESLIQVFQQINLVRRYSAVVGPESLEADSCPFFREMRDRREWSYFIEKSSQCTQIFPSRTSRACSLPKQKTQRLCVSSGVITRTRIHTHQKSLLKIDHIF